jgi:cytochrome c biogenesis protein CcdA
VNSSPERSRRLGPIARCGVFALLAVLTPLPLAGDHLPAAEVSPSGSGILWTPWGPPEAVRSAEESAGSHVGESVQEEEPVLWYFWREACPFCEQAEPWLDEVAVTYPDLEIRKVNVVRDFAGRTLFERLMAARGQAARAVPTFILDEEVWVGFSRPLAEEMEAAIQRRMEGGPPPPGSRRTTLDMGPLGRVDVGARPMATATVLIAFIDGFNPCSLWVLTVLLAMILGTRSRARIAAVGGTFLLVTAGIYGVFIVGLFAALEVAAHLDWIRVAVALLALAFGLVNVKDFLAFRRGPSLTIPDRFKPRIYRGGRALREDRPLLLILGLTVALAGGVALIELPCTAGFPVIWTSLVSEAAVGRAAFVGLLLLYLGVYLSVEIAILVGAIVTLRATRLQEGHGRGLKLVGGMVMIALAGVLLVDPSIMEELSGSLVVIGGAVALSLLVLLLERRRNRPDDSGPDRAVGTGTGERMS